MENILFALGMIGKIFFIVFFFGFCIFIHEFGHLLAGLWQGLYADKFSIGFGRKIWGKTIHGVECVIGWLPFGGYVSLPQLDPTPEAPKKADGTVLPPGEPIPRAVTAFAGPFFNILFGFVLATFMWIIGVWEPAPANSCTITEVPQILPLYKDGLKMRDTITAIDGKPVSGYWEQLSAALPADASPIKITVLRKDKEEILEYHPEINPEWTAGLRSGDRILKVNGKSFTKGYEEMRQEYLLTKGPEVLLEVNRDGRNREVRFSPAPNPLVEDLASPFFTFVNPILVTSLKKDSPFAKAGVKEGDNLLALNSSNILTPADLQVKLGAVKDSQFILTIGRRDQELELTVPVLAGTSRPGDYGLIFQVVAGEALPGMPAAEAGIQKGDHLLELNGETITDTAWFIGRINASEGRPQTLKLLRGNEEITVTLTPREREVNGRSIYQIGLMLEGGMEPKVIGHPSPWRQFSDVMSMTLRTLGRIFAPLENKVNNLISDEKIAGSKTQIKLNHMSGPPGIVMMLWYKLKYEGLRGGLSFIVLITFSLAFINLLPLPVLDGGHITYAAIELIIRRKIPTKVILTLQNIFAVLLIALMLYISFFDGKRIFQRMLPVPRTAAEVVEQPGPQTGQPAAPQTKNTEEK